MLKADATTDSHKYICVIWQPVNGNIFQCCSHCWDQNTKNRIIMKANQFLPSMFFLHSKYTLTSQASHPMNMFQEADKELSNCLPETTPSRQA